MNKDFWFMGGAENAPKLFQPCRDIYLPGVRFFTKRASSSPFLAKFSRFVNKYFYPLGVGSALNRYENSVTLYSAFADKKLYKTYPEDSIFCNFGSGAFFHKKWKNYDYPGQSSYYRSIQGTEGKDFRAIDLCAEDFRIPEKDDSVSLIYCSHTLEHLELTSAKAFIAECLRILKPNGVMRLALPNTSSDFQIVQHISSQPNANPELLETFMLATASHVLSDTKNTLSKSEIAHLFVESGCSARTFYEMAINAGVSSAFMNENPERHISFWDYSTLFAVAKEAGFQACLPLYQGSSCVLPFTNTSVFDNTEPHIAFYAELVK